MGVVDNGNQGETTIGTKGPSSGASGDLSVITHSIPGSHLCTYLVGFQHRHFRSSMLEMSEVLECEPLWLVGMLTPEVLTAGQTDCFPQETCLLTHVGHSR